MAFKITCLLVAAFVASTNCSPYRFGGSAGATSHTAVGGAVGGEIGKESKDSDGYVAKTRGNVYTNWSGAAGAGGYAGQGAPKFDPNSNVTGIGAGGMVSANVGAAAGGEAGGVYKDGKLNTGASGITSLDKSASATGSGFVGTVEQGEADHVGAYGARAANMPAYGSYGAPYGYNPYGAPYGAPYGSPYGVPPYGAPSGPPNTGIRSDIKG